VPVYQYACTECGEQLEVRQSFTDAALTECPACEGRLRKVLNAVGVVFKGSGFYRNDSRASTNGGPGASASGKEGTAKQGDSTSSASSSKKESSTSSSGGGSDSKGSADKSGGSKPAPAAAH
jgi:putative FmdB family regulatory protein